MHYTTNTKDIRSQKQKVDDDRLEIEIANKQKQIEALEKQREQTEKYYDSLIENLEKSKSKYEELTELVEKAELSAALQQLGIDEETLLNGSEEEFEKLKNAYLDIVFKLNEGNDEVLSLLLLAVAIQKAVEVLVAMVSSESLKI